MTPQIDFITQETRNIIAWVWGTGLAIGYLACIVREFRARRARQARSTG
jgi:hypothetical protein